MPKDFRNPSLAPQPFYVVPLKLDVSASAPRCIAKAKRELLAELRGDWKLQERQHIERYVYKDK